MMNTGRVYISEVIRTYQESGMTSSSPTLNLTYKYLSADGKLITREFRNCRRKTAGTYKSRENKSLTGIRHEQRDGSKLVLEVWNGKGWDVRRLFIYGLTHFDDKLIDHRY